MRDNLLLPGRGLAPFSARPHQGVWRLWPAVVATLLITILVPPRATAGLVTLAEGGPTVPVAQFEAKMFAPEQPEPGRTAPPPSTASVPLPFPIRTANMRPGVVTTTGRLATKPWLLRPMFFAGSDSVSREWLTRNAKQLAKAGASGIVVNVDTLQEFRALQALAPGVPMAPSSAEDVADQLNIHVYPVLITADGLLTQNVGAAR